jgi:rare lipoprotein A
MEGYASWYGKEYHGRMTSSGEVYDMFAFTAAHRTLPLGSDVQVNNLENGKTVVVRINDRGPFIENRIIDLSYSSAKAIDMINQGVAKVRLSLIKEPVSTMTSGYIVQAGSFLLAENAIRFKKELKYLNSPVFIETFETNDDKYYRVRIGPLKDRDSAMEIISQLQKKNIHSYLMSAD